MSTFFQELLRHLVLAQALESPAKTGQLRIPDCLHYTETHEWIAMSEDGIRVGLTDHAQHALDEIVWLRLPKLGQYLEAGECAVVLESDEWMTEVATPFAGQVVSVNEKLLITPSKVNDDPFGQGWLFALKPCQDSLCGNLLSAEDYRQLAIDVIH